MAGVGEDICRAQEAALAPCEAGDRQGLGPRLVANDTAFVDSAERKQLVPALTCSPSMFCVTSKKPSPNARSIATSAW